MRHENLVPDIEEAGHGAMQPPPPLLMSAHVTAFGLESADVGIPEPVTNFTRSVEELDASKDDYDDDD